MTFSQDVFMVTGNDFVEMVAMNVLGFFLCSRKLHNRLYKQHHNLNSYVFRHITETPVTEQSFIENLHELDHKINFVKEQAFNDFKCCSDVKDVLDKLKLKVFERKYQSHSRDFSLETQTGHEFLETNRVFLAINS